MTIDPDTLTMARTLAARGGHCFWCQVTAKPDKPGEYDKRPLGKSWKSHPLTADSVTPHRKATHLALVPASLGLVVIDHDHGESDLVRRYLRKFGVTWQEAPSASGNPAKRHFYVRCSRAFGNANWQLTGDNPARGELRGGSGWVVIASPAAVLEALDLEEQPGVADVIAGLCLARVEAGARHLAHNAAVLNNPRAWRERLAASVADGQSMREAEHTVEAARLDGEVLQAVRAGMDPFVRPAGGSAVFDEHRAAVVWHRAMKDSARTHVPPAWWVADWRTWIVWKGDRWQRVAESGAGAPGIRRTWTDFADMLHRLRVINDLERATITSAARQTAVCACLQTLRGITSASLDTHPDLVLFPSGQVGHLITGEVTDPDPALLMTRALGVDPDFDGTPDTVLRVLREQLPDEACLQWTLTWCVYALSGRTSHHAGLFAHGVPGAGKSTFGDFLLRLAGEYGETVDGELLTTDRQEHPAWLTAWEGTRLVYVDEVRKDGSWRSAPFKKVLSHQMITVRGMRENWRTVRATGKTLITGNDLPHIDGGDDDAGEWRRLRVLPWRRKADPVDADLPHKLADEMPAFLAHLLRLALDPDQPFACLASGAEPPEMRLALADYKAEADTIGTGLQECGYQVTDETHRVKAQEAVTALQDAGVLPTGGHGPRHPVRLLGTWVRRQPRLTWKPGKDRDPMTGTWVNCVWITGLKAPGADSDGDDDGGMVDLPDDLL